MAGPISELQRAGINDSLIDTIVNYVKDNKNMQGRTEERKRSAEDVNVRSGKKAKLTCGWPGCTSLVTGLDVDGSYCFHHMQQEYKKTCGWRRGCKQQVHSNDKENLYCWKHMKNKYKLKPCVSSGCKNQARYKGGKCLRCAGGAEAIKASRMCVRCGLVELVRAGLTCNSCKNTPVWGCEKWEFGAAMRDRGEERDEEEE